MMFNLSSMLIRGGGVLIILILLLWIVDENFIDAEMFNCRENNTNCITL